VPNVKWYSIRNASDPQIPNPSRDIQAAAQQAGEIYTEYGAFTTAASAIATWAVIETTFNGMSQPSARRQPPPSGNSPAAHRPGASAHR
jgi:hypothetical protein